MCYTSPGAPFYQRRGLQQVSAATMSSKSFQGLKEQAEGAAKDAGKKDLILLYIWKGA